MIAITRALALIGVAQRTGGALATMSTFLPKHRDRVRRRMLFPSSVVACGTAEGPLGCGFTSRCLMILRYYS